MQQPSGGQEYHHKLQHNVIIVDDDSVWPPELARTLLVLHCLHAIRKNCFTWGNFGYTSEVGNTSVCFNLYYFLK